MKENYIDVTMGKRKFRFNKFDALTGSQIIFSLFAKISANSDIMDSVNKEELGSGKIPNLTPEQLKKSNATVMNALSSLDRESFEHMQKACLKSTQEITMVDNVVSPIPVMLPDGRWGVGDIANDTVLVFSLTFQSLAFNLSSFFEENALGSSEG